MSNQQPIIEDTHGRKFAMSAAAVVAYIVNPSRQILVLKHLERPGWEVPNGAMDAGESILDGVLREVREEVGDAVQVRPLGTVHAYTFRYDDRIQFMISVAYLLAYEGGAILPGDDMKGSEYKWMTVEEFEAADIIVPRDGRFQGRRAVELYGLWSNRPDEELQPLLDPDRKNKHGY